MSANPFFFYKSVIQFCLEKIAEAKFESVRGFVSLKKEKYERINYKIMTDSKSKDVKTKNKRNRKKWLWLAGMIALTGIGLDHRLKVVYYEIQDRKIRNDVRLALITDLHSCYYGAGQATLIQAIEKSQPDMIALSGDIIDDEMPEQKAWEFLEWAGKNYPTYYVTGNHEHWIKDLSRIKKTLREYGVVVLEGDKEELSIQGQRLDLFGIDDPEAGKDQWQKQLNNAKKQVESEVFSILLTHRPERHAHYRDFDLSLAGHAHGGQWRIPFLLNGLLAPNQGFFPRYAGGKYELEEHTMVVSRGLARESTRIPRFYNRPEYVVIDLKPNEEGK